MISENPEQYIQPLHINGLSGRVLSVKSEKKSAQEILLLYGHHAHLERWWGLVQNLVEYGNVTMPDLPGLGGMDSFYMIGRRPTLDAYADYLAAWIKLRYRGKKITIIGISFGFIIATRMLQRYPELAKQVALVVSIVGFMHYGDFLYLDKVQKVYQIFSRVFSLRPLPTIIRYGFLNYPVIKNIYTRTSSGKRRFKEVGADRFEKLVRYETKLWQINDVRTHWYTTSQFLGLDNCQKQIDAQLFHVSSDNDQYFDSAAVEQHMRIVYQDVTVAPMKSVSHTPSILGSKAELAVMLPRKLRDVLIKQ